ncbi:MAG TPA: amino acid permease [Gaiellaceae bacterium]|nr:amino acid permease [Gaiellaceae bacterium]
MAGDGGAATSTLDAASAPTLKRELGLAMATALVIGNMIGSGIFLLPSSLAAEAGPASLVAWVFTGAGAMFLALVFATLGRAYPKTGGPYVYVRKAFGDLMGFWTAWTYWIALWVGNAAIATAFAGYLAVFWADASSPWTATTLSIALVWAMTLVNLAGVREAGRVQLVTAVIKFVPLLLIGVVGLFYIDTDNFQPFTTVEGFDWGINAAALLTLWAFVGLESATVPAEEVKDPERTIPRATIIGTAGVAAVYLLSSFALFGMIPSATLAESTSPFADGANLIFGGTSGGEAIAIVAMISIVGALNGWILLQGRVPLAAAQDGLFPDRFAAVDEKRGTPVFGIVFSSVLATALLALNFREGGGVVDLFTEIITIATLAALIPYAFAAAAEIYLAIVDRESFSGVNLARSSVIALLALAYSTWAIRGAGYEAVTEGFMLLLVGMPVFLWVTWRGRRGQAGGSEVAASPSILSP